jgi:hypothetical protein
MVSSSKPSGKRHLKPTVSDSTEVLAAYIQLLLCEFMAVKDGDVMIKSDCPEIQIQTQMVSKMISPYHDPPCHPLKVVDIKISRILEVSRKMGPL